MWKIVLLAAGVASSSFLGTIQYVEHFFPEAAGTAGTKAIGHYEDRSAEDMLAHRLPAAYAKVDIFRHEHEIYVDWHVRGSEDGPVVGGITRASQAADGSLRWLFNDGRKNLGEALLRNTHGSYAFALRLFRRSNPADVKIVSLYRTYTLHRFAPVVLDL